MYYYVIKNSFNKNPYNPFTKSAKNVWHSELKDEIAWSRKQLNGVIVENLDYRELVNKHEPQNDDFLVYGPTICNSR